MVKTPNPSSGKQFYFSEAYSLVRIQYALNSYCRQSSASFTTDIWRYSIQQRACLATHLSFSLMIQHLYGAGRALATHLFTLLLRIIFMLQEKSCSKLRTAPEQITQNPGPKKNTHCILKEEFPCLFFSVSNTLIVPGLQDDSLCCMSA